MSTYDKNETTRFLGDGVSFKAKLIGILEVSEARGDRMCQEALSDLKMAIRAAGEHKQRITINIAIDGLRLRDEKTGDSLYHHPVHKISFIAQDMTDSRAFGYIFGSPDTGHRFFGIKTDKAASQVVIAMRDLFQVVFALKKKEIELAKQHLDKSRYSNSPIFSDSSMSSAKASSQETTKSTASDCKTGTTSDSKSGHTVVANLVDLELELNSLQQGLHQMERITPSDPFGSKDDPFGDSFTSYTKPILPPPPSSGREKSTRLSESSSICSPKTPQISTDAQASDADTTLGNDIRKGKQDLFLHDFNTSHDQTAEEDWFNSSSDANGLEKSFFVPEPTKEEKHEKAKLEILSQFDVFTDLDPLGTGRSKPYVDKKLFFQELKNPPKKVLNDLVSQPHQLESVKHQTTITTKPNEFTSTDPFGDDPFIAEDPFAESDFYKQDPFDTEFTDFKNQLSKSEDFEHFKFDTKSDSSKASKVLKTSLFEKQISLISSSPKNNYFVKQNTLDKRFDKFDSTEDIRLLQIHSNQSVESDNVPEPPPRPEATLMQIKPPPLPPKKQINDLLVKPPPRPPPSEEPHLERKESEKETISSSFEFNKMTQKSPPLPVPARKSRFESDFSVIPERPSKNHSVDSSDDNYLTPISFPEQKSETKTPTYSILLPPPQKSIKKQMASPNTVTSQLQSKNPILTTEVEASVKTCPIEGLDITLSQLTLSGLNELAIKLNIPSKQLSSMTLVQLTNYLSNFINAKASPLSNSSDKEKNVGDIPPFKADFASNFGNMNHNSSEAFDRYAVFRELMNEGLKQTKIDTEPEEIQNEKNEIIIPPAETKIDNIYCTEEENGEDKYAALREIVENELKINADLRENKKNETKQPIFEQNILIKEENENINNKENTINIDEAKPESPNFIEYNSPIEYQEDTLAATEKSPKSSTPKIAKSPIPVAVSEIIQNSRLNSGSLSDVASGSSPEVDNTVNSDEKKEVGTAGESWAIFDQTNIPMELPKGKPAAQSEEGLSPWSSDSKEFGNGSPPDWRRGDSGSGGDCWTKRRSRRDHDGWWDTSAEPETEYYASNRRSNDSYEEEYYDCYEKPRRRKQVAYLHGSQGAGGHSSSSRDVSPWEEEPRRSKEQRSDWIKHAARQYSLEKQHRDRRHTDSWDDEDDNEYEEDHIRRFHRTESRERYNPPREYELDRWNPDWIEERRLRRRREGERDKWCCSDWDQNEYEKSGGRYESSRWMGDGHSINRRDRKIEDRYYSRDSQESPWEDENNEVMSSNYLSTKRNWKRPSSASEMDRKTGEVKSRYHLGGSDGERDKRHKPPRRSRSRDSQYSEVSHRHKSDGSAALRSIPYRNKIHSKSKFENDFSALSKKQSDAKVDNGNKKSATLTSKERKKIKESLEMEENIMNTFPRKSARVNSYFENNFASTEESPISSNHMSSKFNFENELTSEPDDSPSSLKKPLRESRPSSKLSQNDELDKNIYRKKTIKDIHSSQTSHKSKSLFEDDFSPSDKPEVLPEENSISSIKEEIYPDEEGDTFSTKNFEIATNSRKKMNKTRRANSVHGDGNIKKSESVNIFTRESDPFDDDFFCENDSNNLQENLDIAARTTDLKWTDDFEDINRKHKNNQRFDN